MHGDGRTGGAREDVSAGYDGSPRLADDLHTRRNLECVGDEVVTRVEVDDLATRILEVAALASNEV